MCKAAQRPRCATPQERRPWSVECPGSRRTKMVRSDSTAIGNLRTKSRRVFPIATQNTRRGSFRRGIPRGLKQPTFSGSVGSQDNSGCSSM